MNIHERAEENVNGVIVGGGQVAGQLYYGGTPRSGMVYKDSEEELVTYFSHVVSELKDFDEKMASRGDARRPFYADDSKWHFRVY